MYDHDRIQASAERKTRRITKRLYKSLRYQERPRGGDGRLWIATLNENRTILTKDHPDYDGRSAEDQIFSKVVVSHGNTERQYQGLKDALQCEIFDKVEGVVRRRKKRVKNQDGAVIGAVSLN